MAVLICTRSLELKVPSGALINLGVREERRFLERDSEERKREARKKDSCYRRTRSPQDVIAEQTEGPRTISINEITFLLRLLLPSFPFEKGTNMRLYIYIYRSQTRESARIRNSVSSNRFVKMRRECGARERRTRRTFLLARELLEVASAEDVFVGTRNGEWKGKEDRVPPRSYSSSILARLWWPTS